MLLELEESLPADLLDDDCAKAVTPPSSTLTAATTTTVDDADKLLFDELN